MGIRYNLRGAPAESRKQRMEGENARCIGGMREPHRTVDMAPGAHAVGIELRSILQRFMDANPCVKELAHSLLQGQDIPKEFEFNKDVKAKLRNEIISHLGCTPNQGCEAGISSQVIEAYCLATGDPDAVLAQWIREGAPIGILREVESTGVFPIVAEPEDRVPAEEFIRDHLAANNHASAADEADIVLNLLLEGKEKGHCRIFGSWEELANAVGTSSIVLNPFGLVTKVKDDGTTKHRVIWDLKASKVNLSVHQGERIVLPRISHIVTDILELARSCAPGEQVWLVCYDIADAFNNIPVHPEETPFTCAHIEASSGTKYVVFDSLVFGSGSSPTVWGRFAAWLGRSTAAILSKEVFRQEIYVDDPILFAKGVYSEVVNNLSIALLWTEVAGFPVAWHKAHGGKKAVWIGASISIDEGLDDPHVSVSITEAKIKQLEEITSRLLQSPVVPQRELRSYAGSMSFVAGLVKFVRPFLNSIWAALSASDKGSRSSTNDDQGSSQSLPSSGQTVRSKPSHLVKIKRCSHALRWIRAFLQDIHGPLQRRIFFAEPSSSNCLRIAVDASPWGIGGILLNGTTIVHGSRILSRLRT